MSKKIFSTMMAILVGGAMVFGQNDDMPPAVQMIVKPYDKTVGDAKKNAITALEKLQKQYEGTKNEKGLASVKAELARIKGDEGDESTDKMFNDILGNNDPKWISKDATFELSSVHTSNPYFLTFDGKEKEYSISTRCKGDVGEDGWCKIDLGNVYEIANIDIFNRTDVSSQKIINTELFISPDDKKWLKIETIKKDKPLFTIKIKKSARYIKLQSNNPTGILTLKAIKIYGK